MGLAVVVVDNFEVDIMLDPDKIVDFVEDIMAAVGTFLGLCKNIVDLQDPSIVVAAAGIIKAVLRILEHLEYCIVSLYFYQIIIVPTLI